MARCASIPDTRALPRCGLCLVAALLGPSLLLTGCGRAGAGDRHICSKYEDKCSQHDGLLEWTNHTFHALVGFPELVGFSPYWRK